MKFAGLIVLLGASVGIAAAQQPTIRQQQGVENAASYSTSNPPGSLVAIFGSNFSSETLTASSTPLTLQIQSKTETISVTVNGKEAPMFYATPNQASVQLPWETVTGNGSIVLTRNGVKSSAYAFPVATFSPGIYTTTQDGKGMAWVINNNDGTVAQPSAGWPFPKIQTRPAKAGDNLFFYITGLGPVSPSIEDGHAPCLLSGCPANVVLPKATNTVTVLIGGVAIPSGNVQFAGLSPQFVGTYQVNFKMPSGVPASNTTTLQVGVGNATSNTVTFATQ